MCEREGRESERERERKRERQRERERERERGREGKSVCVRVCVGERAHTFLDLASDGQTHMKTGNVFCANPPSRTYSGTPHD